MSKQIVKHINSPGSVPFLSIIIPAFNEAERLPETLRKIVGFVQSRDFDSEVLVVDNASTDRTREIILDFHSKFHFVHYLLGTVQGKGAAVRTGVQAAKGDYLLLSDADLAVPIEEATKFLPPLLQDYDIAIGSREATGARRYGEPFHRHLMGRVFNIIVRALLLPGLHDTQCGFKCFRREVGHKLFSLSAINGWSFDVEILFIGFKKGYVIAEVPVNWYYGEGSKVKPLRDTLLMLRELLQIRKRWGSNDREEKEY